MSLPVVLHGSHRPVPRSLVASLPVDNRRPRCISNSVSRLLGSHSRLLPVRPLLSLGLLQLVLGSSMVALSLGALSLSSSPPVRNSCPFWAGSSVILSGIIGLTTWRRPMFLLVNLFILLSVVCVLLNLAGFIMCCQGAQLVSSMTNCQLSETGELCYCCADSSECPEEKLLKLYPGHSCTTMRILLKKVLFALCALNALTTAVCLVAAALRYLQIFSGRQPCTEAPQPIPDEGEMPPLLPDPDEFVPPAPPPSYFSILCSYTPRLAHRMFGDSVIPLPHIYGARIKGVEVFCPLDPPPPYELITGASAVPCPQETDLTEVFTERSDVDISVAEAGSPSSNVPLHPAPICDQRRHSPALNVGKPSPSPAWSLGALHHAMTQVATCKTSHLCRLYRSSSDPVLVNLADKALSCKAATQTDIQPMGDVSTLKMQTGKGLRHARPSSMVDYQSYSHTQQLVTRFLQHSSSSLTPEVQELVNNIKTVLRSDQEHMEEAVRCAGLIDQVITMDPAEPTHVLATCASQTLPMRRQLRLLHLRSCGDLSTFSRTQLQPLEHRTGSRAGQERPRSLIGVFKETVL